MNHHKRREDCSSGPTPAFGHLNNAVTPDGQNAPDPDAKAARKTRLRETMQRRTADAAGARP